MKCEHVLRSAVAIGFTAFLYGQVDVNFSALPKSYQLYPRNNQNEAMVTISGSVITEDRDSIFVNVYRNGTIFTKSTIHAELAEYSFTVLVDSVLVAQRDSVVCGDAFLISGQSNALAYDFEGKATEKREYVRSFGTSSLNPAAVTADTTWGLAQGKQEYAHMAVGVWGLLLAGKITDLYGIPVCILNGAKAGTPISHHFRDNSNHTNLNTVYGRLLHRAQKAGITEAVRAIFWYQGESDSDENYGDYHDSFGGVRWAWHGNFPNLETIYVFQIRPSATDCGFGFQSQLREIQRQLPERYADVKLMSTNGIEGHYLDGCHYYYIGYKNLAEAIFPLVTRDFYGSSNVQNIRPPNIINAFQSGNNQLQVTLIFDQPVNWPEPYQGIGMEKYIYLGSKKGLVKAGHSAPGNKIILDLYSPLNAKNITYLPEDNYHNTTDFYKGPWLKNPRNVGALAFYKYPLNVYSPPLGGNDEITVNEDQPYIFTTSDFTFSDIDGHTFSGILVEELPGAGYLVYAGESVVAGQHCDDLSLLSYLSGENQNGNNYTTIKFRVKDSSGAVSGTVYSMSINVRAVNDAPVINTVEDVIILEDSGEATITLEGIRWGPDLEDQVLTITATSSDPNIIPHPEVDYSSPENEATLVFRPADDVFGSIELDIIVKDDGGTENLGVDSAVVQIQITVEPVNDPPYMAPISDLNIGEDSVGQMILLTGIRPGIYEDDQTLTITATSENAAIIPDPVVSYLPQSDTGRLDFSPAPDANGNAKIIVTVRDNGGTANGGVDLHSQSFQIEVFPVNDSPRAFGIIEPLENIDLTITKSNLRDTLTIKWESSVDPEGDVVYYNLLVSGDLSDLSRNGITGNELKLSFEELLAASDTAHVAQATWNIVATDNDLENESANGPLLMNVDGRSLWSATYGLDQNFPNPFNNATRIGYDLPESGIVRLVIYDLTGRKIKELVNKRQKRGYSSIVWNGRNYYGELVGSGVYICYLQVNDFTQTRKLILIR
jgi:hypothetical protein